MELNGLPAGIDDLRAVALVSYGHFTSMQVHNGCVRGLDLHLLRLDQATRELFGCPLDIEQVRGWMRRSVGEATDPLSLRVDVFARRLDRDRLNTAIEPDVLVTSGAARVFVPLPARICSVRYVRDMPHIKHRGTFGLFHQKRLAQAHGFDDALFVDADGAISEGTFWNVGFFDGARIVWPDAPALNGISMQMLKRGLHALGLETITRRIGLAEIGAFRSAFITNTSRAARPVASIDLTEFVIDPDLFATFDTVVAGIAWQRL